MALDTFAEVERPNQDDQQARNDRMADIRDIPEYGKWQPIETAPKDGRRVLIYSQGLVGTSRFIKETFWYSDQLDRAHSPTHWQPMPPAPEAK